ncbi:MAG: spermidine/putrescine ABC transporter ATP-binding protein [Eubacteriales Family XIII. Incertae Sedis bacterium]|nr:MAG: spermidine/putrescine ABC transporter ATP-binding protein [Clostridiales Family XIII bacterium]
MHNKNTLISLRNVSVEFDGTRVLDKINLDIGDKEFVTLLGPSGCGKTTTLRIIGGFVEPTEGDVFFDGQKINGLPPHKRHVNTVFQRYALFPHLNVYENVEFGLKISKIPEEERRKRVKEMLALVNLRGFELREVGSLSGGQQQRVAIARALVNHPRVLLLDEPLGALDLKLRKEMQIELKRIQQQLEITFLYVTHDQEEALTMSDRVVVMRDGEILQIGSPTDIYNEPVNAYVADFIGESNIIDGIMNEDFVVSFAGVTIPCSDSGFGKNRPVDVVIRPEDWEISEDGSGIFNGVVESTVFKGVHFENIVDTGSVKFMVHTTQEHRPGSRIGLSIIPEYIHIMNKMGKDETLELGALEADSIIEDAEDAASEAE